MRQGTPGWHPDPAGRFDSRYWDGHGWTRAVMRDGQVDTDPADVPADAGPQATIRESAEPTLEGPVPALSASDRFTSLAPEEAQSRVSQMLVVAGFSLVEATPGRLAATVAVAGEPNWIIVIALCFFWLLPGLVYWYVKARPVAHAVSLQFLAAELGARIVIRGESQALERLAPVLAPLPW